jgi:uncharacterized protein YndB with AHSA1/START domain
MNSTIETISIEKVFPASLHAVWNSWTDPECIMQWFGSDPNGKVLKASLDVRPGGHFEITFQDGDMTKHTCTGKYTEVLEFSKLSFTWMWKSEPGVESLVTVLLTAKGNITKMQFEHANTGNESKHAYYKGWQDTFSKLERILSSNYLSE